MKVLIVDDDPLVSGALKVILENEPDMEVAATAQSGEEGIEACRKDDFDVIVMDIRMDGLNGLECASEILKFRKDAKILFLTTFLDDEYINTALKVGARGYILKQDCQSLASSVRAVYGGQTVFGGKVVEKLPDILNRKDSFNPEEFGITETEAEIIRYVADGKSNKEIASSMYLGEGTVRNHVSSILSKLDLRDRTQLACFYYQKIKP